MTAESGPDLYSDCKNRDVSESSGTMDKAFWGMLFVGIIFLSAGLYSFAGNYKKLREQGYGISDFISELVGLISLGQPADKQFIPAVCGIFIGLLLCFSAFQR